MSSKLRACRLSSTPYAHDGRNSNGGIGNLHGVLKAMSVACIFGIGFASLPVRARTAAVSRADSWSLHPSTTLVGSEPEHIYRIQSVATLKVLDVPGGSSEDGAVIQQWRWWAGSNQQWHVIPIAGEPRFYRIEAVASEKSLTVPNGPTPSPTRIEQWAWAASDNQKWRLTQVDQGIYTIESKGSGGLVLDVPNGDCQDGLEVQQFALNGGANQHWLFLDGASPIPAKHAMLKRDGLDLGAAVGPEDATDRRRVQHYESGTILWSVGTGAHEVHGAIQHLYSILGWDGSWLGLPVSDESDGPEGRARFNAFEHGSIQWTPGGAARAYNIGDAFIATQRNDDDTMQHHMKMYRDEVSADAVVVEDPHINYPPDLALTYYGFICHPWWPDDKTDPDGDLDFRVVILPETYGRDNWDPGTWAFGGGDNKPGQIKDKLVLAANVLRCEVLMYGRSGSCNHDNHFEPPLALLPGWAESGPSSGLIEGVPIMGRIERGPREGVEGPPGVPAASRVMSIAGRRVHGGSVVHLTGFLGLDCHGWGCNDGEAFIDNVELHPLYTIDVLSGDGSEGSRALCEEISTLLPLLDKVRDDFASNRNLAVAADLEELSDWHRRNDGPARDRVLRVESSLPKRCE